MFNLLNTFTNNNVLYKTFEYESTDLYVCFIVDSKTNTVMEYSYRNNQTEGHEQCNISLSLFKKTINTYNNIHDYKTII